MSLHFNGTEKRKHARYEWEAPVVLTAGETVADGDIQNISMGGILVTSTMDLKYGDEVTAEFTVPKLDKKIRARCTVRWIQGEHSSGLSFVGLKAIETWAVSQLVRKLAENQTSLE